MNKFDGTIKQETEGKEVIGNSLEDTYLGFCKTPEEVEQAMKIIENSAKKYYYSNPNLYKNNQLEPEDLEQIIHYHLMIKHRNRSGLSKNGGFSANSFSNLKTMCTMSMNATLRGISMKKDIKKKVKNEDGTISNELVKKIYVSSLTEMIREDEEDNLTTGRKDIILSDNGEDERKAYVMAQLNMFSDRLNEVDPLYNKIFKVNSFLNDSVSLLTEKEEKELVHTFEDLLYSNIKSEDHSKISPKNRKINLNEIVKRIIFGNDDSVESDIIKAKVKEYNQAYNEVCLSMR